jgi:hypothetical protein
MYAELLIDQAGPDVFHHIFKEYCGPGGVLRDFSVVEIIAKAAWVRSSYTKLQEENSWSIPNWVEQIPTLV